VNGINDDILLRTRKREGGREGTYLDQFGLFGTHEGHELVVHLDKPKAGREGWRDGGEGTYTYTRIQTHTCIYTLTWINSDCSAPMSATSSSYMILINSWSGVTPFVTSMPGERREGGREGGREEM